MGSSSSKDKPKQKEIEPIENQNEKNKPIRKFQEQTHHKEKIEIKKSE